MKIRLVIDTDLTPISPQFKKQILELKEKQRLIREEKWRKYMREYLKEYRKL